MDNEIKDQIKQCIDDAHPAVKSFILSDDFDDSVSDLCSNFFLNPEEETRVSNIIVMTLVGILDPNSLDQELSSIETLTPKEAVDLSNAIKATVIDTFVNHLAGDISKSTENVGDSFEKTILNQAIAMRPIGEVPVNLPTSENAPSFGPRQQENGYIGSQSTADNNTQNSPKGAIHNYIGNTDPYREPLG